MKIIIYVVIAFAVMGVVFAGYQYLQPKEESTSNTQISTNPTRPAEINGKVVSIAGNQIVIANEVGKIVLSEEEQAARKASMQKMSEEERKAAREAEQQNVATENITLIIPVGVPIVMGTGDGSGNTQLTDLASINKGTYLSIWKSGENIDFVKIKGI